jgi:hypothetical protein
MRSWLKVVLKGKYSIFEKDYRKIGRRVDLDEKYKLKTIKARLYITSLNL